MAAPVIPNEFVGHGRKRSQNPDPLTPKGSGTRKSMSSSSVLTYWSGIIPPSVLVKRKNRERVRHPPSRRDD
jgi:hypothetical protein